MLRKPYIFVIFQGGEGGGPDPLPPSGSAHVISPELSLFISSISNPFSHESNR